MYSISRAGWACIPKMNAGTGTNQKLNRDVKLVRVQYNMLDVFSHVNAFMCLYYCRSIAKTRSTSVWDVMIPSFLVACLAGWKLRNPNPWNSMEHTMFRIVLSFKNAWSLFLFGTNNLRSAMGHGPQPRWTCCRHRVPPIGGSRANLGCAATVTYSCDFCSWIAVKVEDAH